MEINRGSDMRRSHSVLQLSILGSLCLSLRGLGFRVMIDRPCLQCLLVRWFVLMDEDTRIRKSGQNPNCPMRRLPGFQWISYVFFNIRSKLNYGQGHSKVDQVIEESGSLLAINVTWSVRGDKTAENVDRMIDGRLLGDIAKPRSSPPCTLCYSSWMMSCR